MGEDKGSMIRTCRPLQLFIRGMLILLQHNSTKNVCILVPNGICICFEKIMLGSEVGISNDLLFISGISVIKLVLPSKFLQSKIILLYCR